MNEISESWHHSPDWVRSLAGSNLEPGESALTWFEPDLDTELHYTPGTVVLTDRRILSFTWERGARVNGKSGTTPKSFQSWSIGPEVQLTPRESAGVGRLELFTSSHLAATWRYTMSRSSGAHRVVDRFDALQRGIAPTVTEQTQTAVTGECPVCGSPMREGASTCVECGASLTRKPVWSLLRLFSVAPKYLWAIILGFILTLA